ncbi:hypothetical protein HAP47_0032705 [Bradyrhizobium sp. 41S5]|uniref:hypothetical protein n=1 Tax=Bradyrhizobium sp. 41S5 TaxID=1404443 RepID=UPI00156B7487|nr:hypothetical protein [Bradyrhizobium sp. 41S5]UFX43929.1 hypothetical protein HAP47_0032705 [Bradyrhizobium sp. 41S5]
MPPENSLMTQGRATGVSSRIFAQNCQGRSLAIEAWAGVVWVPAAFDSDAINRLTVFLRAAPKLLFAAVSVCLGHVGYEFGAVAIAQLRCRSQ